LAISAIKLWAAMLPLLAGLGLPLCAWGANPAPAAPATPPAAPAGAPLQDVLALIEAYQSGYLQVVEAAAFQVYYSTGIIATDISNGFISDETALFALQRNSLLQSACVTTLAAVYERTPAEDATSRASIKRLWDLFILEDALLRTLSDSLGAPDEAAQQAVDTARAQVEQALKEYSAGLPQ
jgi:hypothetical protein